MLTFMGLILRENDRGETSKSVTVLTAERGVIDIFVRGGRKSTKNASSTQLFAYSKLCVEEKKNAKDQSMFFLNSSESEKLFYKFFALFSLLDFFSSFSPRFILFFALYLSYYNIEAERVLLRHFYPQKHPLLFLSYHLIRSST